MHQMRGATTVRIGVAKYFKDAYPDMRARLIRSWDANPADIPMIEVFNPFDNTAMSGDSAPILGVDVGRSTSFGQTDIEPGAVDEYRPKYSVTITAWVWSRRDDEGAAMEAQLNRASVIRMRDDMTAILQAILLDRPSMGTEWLCTIPSSLTVEYPEPSPSGTNNQRWLACGRLLFDVQYDEHQLRTSLNDPLKPRRHIIEAEVDNTGRDSVFNNIGKYP